MAQSLTVDTPQLASDCDDDENVSQSTITGLSPPRRKKRAYSYKYCEHCHQNVSKTTYYSHKVLLAEESPSSSSDDAKDIDRDLTGDDLSLMTLNHNSPTGTKFTNAPHNNFIKDF